MFYPLNGMIYNIFSADGGFDSFRHYLLYILRAMEPMMIMVCEATMVGAVGTEPGAIRLNQTTLNWY